MPEQSNDYRVVVFGAGGVGKSSLVLRFIKGTFRESYIPTIEDTYRQVCCFPLFSFFQYTSYKVNIFIFILNSFLSPLIQFSTTKKKVHAILIAWVEGFCFSLTGWM